VAGAPRIECQRHGCAGLGGCREWSRCGADVACYGCVGVVVRNGEGGIVVFRDGTADEVRD